MQERDALPIERVPHRLEMHQVRRAADLYVAHTHLHALAVPDADPATLRRPDDAAAEIIATLLAALPARHDAHVAEHA